MQSGFNGLNSLRPSALPGYLSCLFLALAVVAVVAIPAGSASAAEAQGTFSMTLGYGKSGKTLKRAGVKISAVSASQQKRLKGKRVRITAPLKAVKGDAGVFVLRSGIKFSKGKRNLVARQLRVKNAGSSSRVNANVQGKWISLFVADGEPVTDPVARTFKIDRATLRLTRQSAKQIRTKLRTGKIPVGEVGNLGASVNLAFEDPYSEICGVPANTLTVGTVPPAGPLPVLSGASATVGEPISWGIKKSLNGYVNGIGAIHGVDGATVNRVPMAPPQVPPTDFTFQFSKGELAENGAGTGDDQAILNGTGTVVYCNEPHGFRIAVSNPTVVIDGTSSRLVADVDTNTSGDWMPTQRVDLADLDLSSSTVTVPGPGSVKWAGISATLSQNGSDALRLCEVNVPGAPPFCLYPAGTALDDLTVTASTG